MAPGNDSRVHSWHELNDLTADLVRRVGDLRYRHVLGVVGPPGAGKSTVAHQIVDTATMSVPANVAPMDGFHRSAEELESMGLLELKGVPESFDAEGFVRHVAQLVQWPPFEVAWPTYDRSRQSVVQRGTTVAAADKLVVVEGNYLLLDDAPWNQIPGLLNEIWYLDVPLAVLVPRLLERQRIGRDEASASAKVLSTDLPNAKLVDATKSRADIVIAHHLG